MANVTVRDGIPQPEVAKLPDIWNAAVEKHSHRTGYDIRKLTSKDRYLCKLAQCQTSTEARRILDGLLDPLHSHYLHRNLLTFLDVFLAINEATGELVASLGAPGGKSILVAFGIVLKAVRAKQDRVESLETIFEKLIHFLKRFQLREQTRSFTHNVDVMVPIFASVLNVMGLATAILKGRWLSNAWHAFLGNKDIHNAEAEIDRLFNAEMQSDVVQHLVHEHEHFHILWNMLQNQEASFRKREEALKIRDDMITNSLGKLEDTISTLRSNSTHCSHPQPDSLVVQNTPFSISFLIPSTEFFTAVLEMRHLITNCPAILADRNVDPLSLAIASVATFVASAATVNVHVGIINAAMFFCFLCGVMKSPSNVYIIVEDVERGKRLQFLVVDCQTWQDFNYLLKKRFRDPKKIGYHFIHNEQYEIEDSTQHLITEETWTPKPGNISITVLLPHRQKPESQASESVQSISCPYCQYDMPWDLSAATQKCKNQDCGQPFLMSEDQSQSPPPRENSTDNISKIRKIKLVAEKIDVPQEAGSDPIPPDTEILPNPPETELSIPPEATIPVLPEKDTSTIPKSDVLVSGSDISIPPEAAIPIPPETDTTSDSSGTHHVPIPDVPIPPETNIPPPDTNVPPPDTDNSLSRQRIHFHFRTMLSNWAHQNGHTVRIVESSSGPVSDVQWTITVYVDSIASGQAIAPSRGAATESACRAALAAWNAL